MMEMLRASNNDMDDLLTSLWVPRTEATTLERPLILEFTKLIHKMVIVLFPRDLGKLELVILHPRYLIESHFIVKIKPLSKKRKELEPAETSSSQGKEKEIMIHNPKTLKSLLMKCIIWNTRGANSIEFRRHYKSMINIHKPIMIALLETKMSDYSSLVDELGF